MLGGRHSLPRTRSLFGHDASGVAVSGQSRRWLSWCTRACSPARAMSARGLPIPTVYCMLADISLPRRCLGSLGTTFSSPSTTTHLRRHRRRPRPEQLPRPQNGQRVRRAFDVAAALVVYFLGALSSSRARSRQQERPQHQGRPQHHGLMLPPSPPSP